MTPAILADYTGFSTRRSKNSADRYYLQALITRVLEKLADVEYKRRTIKEYRFEHATEF
jgi:hypothetical protein